MTPAFDTLRFVERLKDAGMSDGHAKALAEAFRDAQGEADLVTKADLRGAVTALRGELREAVTELRGELREAITGLRGELTLLKWMMDFLLGGVVALVLKAFFPL